LVGLLSLIHRIFFVHRIFSVQDIFGAGFFVGRIRGLPFEQSPQRAIRKTKVLFLIGAGALTAFFAMCD
jgi:hypothetical protein